MVYDIYYLTLNSLFQNTFAQLCDLKHQHDHNLSRRPTYSSLNRFQQTSIRYNRNTSTRNIYNQRNQRSPNLNSPPEENPSVHSEPAIQRINSVKLLANTTMNGNPTFSESISEIDRPSISSRASSKEDLILQMHVLSRNSRDSRYTPVTTNRNGVYFKRPRIDSENLSQATVITTVNGHHQKSASQTNLDNVKMTTFGRPLTSVIVKKKSASSITSQSSRTSFRQRKPHKRIGAQSGVLKTPINFYQLAHRLRTIFHTHSAGCEHTMNITPRHTSNYSVGSTTANTISNSSLQDLDDMEFSSTDLVRYMGELNRNIT